MKNVGYLKPKISSFWGQGHFSDRHILLLQHKWEDQERAPRMSKAKQWF